MTIRKCATENQKKKIRKKKNWEKKKMEKTKHHRKANERKKDWSETEKPPTSKRQQNSWIWLAQFLTVRYCFENVVIDIYGSKGWNDPIHVFIWMQNLKQKNCFQNTINWFNMQLWRRCCSVAYYRRTIVVMCVPRLPLLPLLWHMWVTTGHCFCWSRSEHSTHDELLGWNVILLFFL